MSAEIAHQLEIAETHLKYAAQMLDCIEADPKHHAPILARLRTQILHLHQQATQET